MLLLARLVRVVTALVVLVIVLGILFRVLDANTSNAIVGAVNDVASWLVTPFKGIFSLDEPKTQVVVNWGLAALIYGIVGALIASLLARAGLGRRDRDGVDGRRDVAY